MINKSVGWAILFNKNLKNVSFWQTRGSFKVEFYSQVVIKKKTQWSNLRYLYVSYTNRSENKSENGMMKRISSMAILPKIDKKVPI